MTTMTSWDMFEGLRSAQDELLRMNRAHGQRLSPAGYFGQWFDPAEGQTRPLVPAILAGSGGDLKLMAKGTNSAALPAA